MPGGCGAGWRRKGPPERMPKRKSGDGGPPPDLAAQRAIRSGKLAEITLAVIAQEGPGLVVERVVLLVALIIPGVRVNRRHADDGGHDDRARFGLLRERADNDCAGRNADEAGRKGRVVI